MTALVAKSDITTTRGEVLSGSSTQYDEEGRPLAVDLDFASCGTCGMRPFPIYGSLHHWTDEGRPMVKDNVGKTYQGITDEKGLCPRRLYKQKDGS